MATQRTKAQVRADRVAQKAAGQLAEMAAQQRKIKAEMRAAKRELQKAEKAALVTAQQDLGALLAQLVGAATSDEVAELHGALAAGEITHLLHDWEWRLRDEEEVNESCQEAHQAE